MLYYLYHINNKDSLYFYLISSCFAGGSKRWTFSETVDIRDFTVCIIRCVYRAELILGT